jgi:DNA-binding NarL/FixJ family response regulator
MPEIRTVLPINRVGSQRDNNESVTGARFRVVVADDNVDMRELLTTALQAGGRFDVVGQADDGDVAVDVVAATQPDLVLLDLGMPGAGGLDALPAMRQASPTSRVVVVSGFPRGRLAEMVAARGAVGYVEKGMSPRRLVDEIISVAGVLEVVERILDQRSTQLAQDVRSSAGARRFMEETLERWDCGDVLDVVNILVSELVTNAVKHALSDADVAVLLTPSAIRIEVSDGGSAMPNAKALIQEGTRGRGLAIVDAMASAWGVVPRPQGKTVWFEVPRLDAVSPSQP